MEKTYYEVTDGMELIGKFRSESKAIAAAKAAYGSDRPDWDEGPTVERISVSGTHRSAQKVYPTRSEIFTR